MRWGRESAHVQPDLGDDRLSGGDTDAGDLIQSCHRRGDRGDLGIDALLHPGYIGGDGVDPREHLPEQERVMLAEPSRSTPHVRLAVLDRMDPRASSASTAGSRWPPINAAIIARPDIPNSSLTTTHSLIRAPSSSFSARCFSAVRAVMRSNGSGSDPVAPGSPAVARS